MTVPTKETVRLAAVGDLHCPKTSEEILDAVFSHANDQADILLLCGDFTDYGKPEEASILAKLLASVKRIRMDMTSAPLQERLCQDTLLSWSQYLGKENAIFRECEDK